MEIALIDRLKTNIARQRQSLGAWLRGASPRERSLRAGPAGEQALERHVHTLDEALQKAETNSLGLCTVCHDYVETSRLEMDYTASVCIEHLTGEERSSLEAELELSQKVQLALLPRRAPEIPGLQIAAFSQPAHIVGGDYFDFLRAADGSHVIAIADVMGKGMPASMLMASLQTSLRIIAPESRNSVEIVARLNRLFVHNIQLTKFVTLFVGKYDAPSRSLAYVNAGHNPPMLIRKDGLIEHLQPTGAAIGLVDDAQFSEAVVTIGKGDRLLLYTDGVIEAGGNGSDDFFGEDRLELLVREWNDNSPQELIAALRSQLQSFARTPTPSDDTTIIAIRAI